MFTRSFIVSLLLSLVISTSATPLDASVIEERAAASCKKKDYGPFKLFIAPEDPQKEWLPVKLIDLYTPRPTNDTIRALSICADPECGRTPVYWTLEDQVLSAVFMDAQEGFKTINMALQSDGPLKFVTSDEQSVRRYRSPAWCAKRNPSATNGLPGLLSAEGSAENFSICTNIPSFGTPDRADIQYKARVPGQDGLERYCSKVHLVMQSIGIVAEPIPA
ncbi:hypothetical protein FRC16_004732 [Serendipita sp. 398]|nr:hypothetical protein FRC16_004732 [Serendipita sp. 398]